MKEAGMVYKVAPTERQKAENRFEFEVPNPDFDPKKAEHPEKNAPTLVHSLPLLKYLPAKSAELFEAGAEVTGLIVALDTPEAKNAVRELDAEQLKGFMDAWREASGVSVGESSGSDKS
jgi:hypothetical protein